MRHATLLLAVALALPTAPGAGVAQVASVPAWVQEPLPEPDLHSTFDIDRALPRIEQISSAAADVFDAQLAAAILAEMRRLSTGKALTSERQRDDRLADAIAAPADDDVGLSALGGGTVSGPMVIDWHQQLEQTALTGRLGVSRAAGAIEVRFDLQSRVPLATPLVPEFSYNTSAYVKVLPVLRLGAVASGPLDRLATRQTGQSIGPEARLSLPGFGGSLDAGAGWRLPPRGGPGTTGSPPGELKWSLSYRKPL
jgi:hypothetical protein